MVGLPFFLLYDCCRGMCFPSPSRLIPTEFLLIGVLIPHNTTCNFQAYERVGFGGIALGVGCGIFMDEF